MFYKGETNDLSERLKRHNNAYEKATKTGVPWVLVWSTQKPSKAEAKSLEKKLKNLSVKRTCDFILKHIDGVPSSDELLIIQKLSEH
jgi:putative endonuclease